MRGDVGGAARGDVVIRFLWRDQQIALRVVPPGLQPSWTVGTPGDQRGRF